MKNLKPTNRYRSVLIEDIVFLQGQDYDKYIEDKENAEANGFWFTPIEYLLQWYYPNEHMQTWHKAKDINTDFLGNLLKIPGYKGYFLFSHNPRLGYIGLSRIVEFSMKVID
jgi:hypothetical protein